MIDDIVHILTKFDSAIDTLYKNILKKSQPRQTFTSTRIFRNASLT